MTNIVEYWNTNTFTVKKKNRRTKDTSVSSSHNSTVNL